MSNAYLKFYYDNVIGLLSKESLQLVYVDTLPAPAALDLRNRILYIRNIDETEDLDLVLSLIVHEIGHALFTNATSDQLNKMPMHIIFNIIEDGYIERMVCKKYPGLKSYLYKLFDYYFLGETYTEGNKITQICNILNYNCKGIKYNHILEYPHFVEPEDIEFLKDIELMCDSAYTKRYKRFLALQQILKKYNEDVEQEQKSDSSKDTTSTSDNNNEDADTQEGASDVSDEKVQEINEGIGLEDAQEGNGNKDDEDEELVQEDISDMLDDSFNDHHKKSGLEDCELQNQKMLSSDNICDIIDLQKYFMNTKEQHIHKIFDKIWNNSRINSLPFINKFNILKNADNYVKTKDQYKGNIDPLKIFTHKWNDNLFTKTTIQPQQTNHHFIIALDWSASMAPIIDKLYEQLCDILHFCNVCDISCEVVLFTTDIFSAAKCRIIQLADTRKSSIFDIRKNIQELFKCDPILRTYLMKKCTSDGKTNNILLSNVKKILEDNNKKLNANLSFRDYTTLNGTSILSTTLWCHERLVLCTAQRKSLILLTDGEDGNIDSFNFRGIQYTNNKDINFAKIHTLEVNTFFKEEYGHANLCIGYGRGTGFTSIEKNISESFTDYVMIHNISKLDKIIIDKIIKTIV